MKIIAIKTATIRLDQFLKWANITGSGGEAKYLITEGFVQVNGEIEKRRGKTLVSGDIVGFDGNEYQVEVTAQPVE